jgi:chorismate-pyruvate lyase
MSQWVLERTTGGSVVDAGSEAESDGPFRVADGLGRRGGRGFRGRRDLNPLFPLDRFYQLTDRTLPEVSILSGQAVPEPYRSILVHNRAMTPTLEAFHGDRTHLQVLASRPDGTSLWRQVVLRLNGSDRPVEFAAIVIHHSRFPRAARREVLEGRRPLGAILLSHQLELHSVPRLFFCVTADRAMRDALCLSGPATLYGRRSVLRDAGGKELAETVEIVPPAGASRPVPAAERGETLPRGIHPAHYSRFDPARERSWDGSRSSALTSSLNSTGFLR